MAERIIPSLAKEGWPRHQEKWTEGTLIWRGRGGWFKDRIDFLANTTPSARSKVAPQHFLDRAATPPQLRRGIFRHQRPTSESTRLERYWSHSNSLQR